MKVSNVLSAPNRRISTCALFAVFLATCALPQTHGQVHTSDQTPTSQPSTSSPPPTNAGWVTNDYNYSGNRNVPFAQINAGNVQQMQLVNTVQLPVSGPLETTPLVSPVSASQDFMYITANNSAWAYNVATTPPTLVWANVNPPTPGIYGSNGPNRGAAISPTCVFLQTDNALLECLSTKNGSLVWSAVLGPTSQNYTGNGAPLYIAANPTFNTPAMIVAGISGGDAGAPGFVKAFNPTTGALIWQFNTTPTSCSDSLAATWGACGSIPHGGGATWTIGSYNPATNTIYWGTGNPARDYDASDRQGTNLYTSSIVGLNALNGILEWYFQPNPGDVRDYDSANTPVLVNAIWNGVQKNLLFQANKNGFFYVLDTGNPTQPFLNAFSFVNQNWATSINPTTGVPTINPNSIPTPSGVNECPGVGGAANWPAQAYSSYTGLYYVQATANNCVTITEENMLSQWVSGQAFLGGNVAPTGTATRYLMAINPVTGTIAWQVNQNGSGGQGGVLISEGTGNLVFAPMVSGAFSAFSAKTGTQLWTDAVSNGTNQWKSSPVAWLANGIEYVAIAGTAPVGAPNAGMAEIFIYSLGSGTQTK